MFAHFSMRWEDENKEKKIGGVGFNARIKK